MEATEATMKDLQNELDKVNPLFDFPDIIECVTTYIFQVAKNYGGGAGVDMTAFPDFKFADVAVDPINVSA